MAPAPRTLAPEPLRLVQTFVNSVDLEDGQDELARPWGLRDWLLERSLIDASVEVGEPERHRSVEVREALRALLLANNGVALDPAAVATLNREHARLELRFAPGAGAELAPVATGVDGALAHILAVVYASILERTWPRLKACRNDACHWAFYDRSKNQSSLWCSMAVCGSRAKSRAYRARRASSA